MKTILALLLLATSSAYAGDRLVTHDKAAVVITGQRATTPYESAEPGGVYIIKDGQQKLALTPDGDVLLGEGATIDYADTVTRAGPRVPLYVVVRVQGERYVMPLYAYPLEDARK